MRCILTASLLALLGCGSNPEAPPPLNERPADDAGFAPTYGVMFDGASTTAETFTAAAVTNLSYARLGYWFDATRPYDQGLTDFDTLVEVSAGVGMTLLPVLSTPDAKIDLASPDLLGRWERFGYQSAVRYGPVGADADGNPTGTFWLEHPSVPYAPIRAWEIWNEPNSPDFGNLSPQTYRSLLHTARHGLRRADAGARIVFGGLSFQGQALDYLEDVASNPTAKCLFDAVAIHPYGNSTAEALDLVKRTVERLEEMKLVGKTVDDDVQIWITEIGWATPSPTWPYCAKTGADGKCAEPNTYTVPSAEVQKERVFDFGSAIEKHRAAWHVGPTFWYTVSDVPTSADNPNEGWWRHCGLKYGPAWWKAGELSAKHAQVKLPPLRCPNQE